MKDQDILDDDDRAALNRIMALLRGDVDKANVRHARDKIVMNLSSDHDVEIAALFLTAIELFRRRFAVYSPLDAAAAKLLPWIARKIREGD